MYLLQVDAETVAAIDDATLAIHVPLLGDRVALRNHLNVGISGKKPQPAAKRRDLFEKLKARMAENGSLEEGASTSKGRARDEGVQAESRARKKTRRIEVGWIHDKKQVRRRAGGGIRKLDVDRNYKKSDIINEALGLFFPEGKSQHGYVKDFNIDLLDFKDNPVPDNATVAECYNLYKTGILSFYVSTASRSSSTTMADIPTTATSVPASVPPKNVAFTLVSPVMLTANAPRTNTQPGPSIPMSMPEKTEDPMTSTTSTLPSLLSTSSELGLPDLPTIMYPPLPLPTYLGVDSLATGGSTHLKENAASTDIVTLAMLANDVTADATFGLSSSEFCDRPMEEPTTSQTAEIQDRPMEVAVASHKENENIIRVHRANIQQEMVCAFKTDKITNTPIKFQFINEKGQDEDGVSREAYTIFWIAFFESSADGESVRVSAIFPEYGMEEWQAVGRILVKGYIEHRVFPLKLAEPFFVALLFGEEAISPDVLIKSYLLYLNDSDRVVVQNALDGQMSEEDRESFIDILDREGSHTIPDTQSTRSCILQVAHKCLVQDCNYALESMRRVVQDSLLANFRDITDVTSMYASLIPTPKRVWELIQATPETKSQSVALKFLQQYIRAQNQSSLSRLLHFLTGSLVMSVDGISVRFVNLVGAGRRPIAHTCGPNLELPSTYNAYREFRAEWDAVLSSEYLAMDLC